MKRRAVEPETRPETAEDRLLRTLVAVDNLADMRAFLHDLCTPSEREAMTDRWRVVPYLLDGVPYREIHEHTAVSITTIGRVARVLGEGNGGYRKAMASGTGNRRSIHRRRTA